MTVPQDQAAGDHTIPVALPAQLHDAGLEDWFAERVRPLVGDEAEDCVDGAWGGLGDGLSSEEVDAVVDRMRRCDGAPERATLTLMVGWNAGRFAEIVRACTPIIEVLATRSRRGRAGLWAQVADSVGGAAYSLHDAEPQIATDTVIGATERLLHAPGAPWKQTPDFWLTAAEGGPVLIKHRGSCCLYYRFDPDAREEQPPQEEEEPDAGHLERFGDDPPHYCATCLFRKPEDVEARMVSHAERVRAGSDVHDLLSHSEHVKHWGR